MVAPKFVDQAFRALGTPIVETLVAS